MYMNICCILFNFSDLILLLTAVILFFTLFVMKNSNEENARFNRLQSVENTIFKQIEFHNNLLKGISINIESTGRGFGIPNAFINADGKDAFQIFYEELKEIYKVIPGYYTNTIDSEEKRIEDSFLQLYKKYGSSFGNYFKNLYWLVKYINTNDKAIKGFDTKFYIGLVKSQLSKYEILLLAYDCIWIQDKPQGENFIELAKITNLLSALEADELINSASSINHLDIFINKYKINFRIPAEFKN